jgi:preprotein translocase subunit YajC
MRIIPAICAAAAVALSAPLAAQSIGMQVVDTAGARVGTVTVITGDNLTIKTDKHEVALPKSSFTLNNGKLLFAMTQAQLDAQIEASLAAANAAVAPGSNVTGVGGTAVGTIEAVADGKVTIALQSGRKLVLPQAGVRGNPDGTATIGYTAEQIDELVKQNTPAEASADPAAAPTGGK